MRTSPANCEFNFCESMVRSDKLSHLRPPSLKGEIHPTPAANRSQPAFYSLMREMNGKGAKTRNRWLWKGRLGCGNLPTTLGGIWLVAAKLRRR
jgi:hypothetical protein